MMKKNRLLYQSLFSIVLLAGSMLLVSNCSAEVAGNKLVEKSAVNSELKSAESSGKDIVKKFEEKLKVYRGQVVYIDFWASWCIPCRQSFPWMNNMQKKYQTQGFKVVTINLDTDKENALEFLQSYPAQFDVVYDPKGKLAKKFKLKGMPNSYMVNRAGKIVSAHVGFNDEKRKAYEQEISVLLAEKQNDVNK